MFAQPDLTIGILQVIVNLVFQPTDSTKSLVLVSGHTDTQVIYTSGILMSQRPSHVF